jgi:hypothetical protein
MDAESDLDARGATVASRGLARGAAIAAGRCGGDSRGTSLGRAAESGSRRAFAEDTVREGGGDGRLADAARSREEVGMRGAPAQFGDEALDQFAISGDSVKWHE